MVGWFQAQLASCFDHTSGYQSENWIPKENAAHGGLHSELTQNRSSSSVGGCVMPGRTGRWYWIERSPLMPSG